MSANAILKQGEVLTDSSGNVMTGDPIIDLGAQNQPGQGTQSSNYAAGGQGNIVIPEILD